MRRAPAGRHWQRARGHRQLSPRLAGRLDPGTADSCAAVLLSLRPLEHLGVLLARKLLAGRHLHHVGVELDTVAVGVVEIERTAATAAEQRARPITTLRPVDQRPALDLDA